MKKKNGRKKGFVLAIIFLLLLVGVDYNLNGKDGVLVKEVKTFIEENIFALSGEESISSESSTTISEFVEASSIKEDSDNKEYSSNNEKSTNIEYSEKQLEVYFYDVGQADSILLIIDGKVMLVDTGNAGDAELSDKISNKINLTHELKRLGIEKIDILVATHPHEDHMGSLYKIIKMFEIGDLYINSLLPEEEWTGYYRRFVEALEEKNVHIVTPTTLSEEEIKGEIEEYNANLMAEYQEEIEKSENPKEIAEPELIKYSSNDYIRVADTIPFDDAVVTMLAPNSAEYSDTNDYSIVLMVEFDDVKLLLTGDAGIESEEEILEFAKKNNVDLNCDILKVGHHGSRTASTQEFISAVDPEYAVIMVAEENSYGLPDEDVLERLSNHGAVIYQTKDKGDIRLKINDGAYEFDFDYSHEVKQDGKQK